MGIVGLLGIDKTMSEQQMLRNILYNKLQELKEYNSIAQAEIKKDNTGEASEIFRDMTRTIKCIDNCLKKGGNFTDEELKTYADLKRIIEQKRNGVYSTSMSRYFEEGNRILGLGKVAALRGDTKKAEAFKKLATGQFGNVQEFAIRYSADIGRSGCPDYRKRIEEATDLDMLARDIKICNNIENKLDEATSYATNQQKRTTNNISRAKKMLTFNSRLIERKESQGSIPDQKKEALACKLAYLDALVSIIDNNR